MTLPRLGTPTADDIEGQLRQRARLKGISRVLRGLGLMRLEDTPDVGLKVFKTKMVEAPGDILAGLRRLGRNPDSETFLRSLKPDIDEDGLESIFGKPPPVSPVSARVTAPFRTPPPPLLGKTDFPGGLKVLGKGLATQFPVQVLSKLKTLTQGGSKGASVRNKDESDYFITYANERARRFVEQKTAQYGEKRLLPRLPLKITDVAQLPQNLAYSAVSGGLGAAAGAPFLLIPVAGEWAFAGVTAGVSGKIAFDLTSYEIMQQYLEMKDAESLAVKGRGITLAEENQLKTGFESEATKYGLWEAVPEGVSNLAGAKLVLSPLMKMFKGSLVKSLVPKLFGAASGEFLTETVTQKGQAGVEFRAGMRENIPTWFEAFKEIAPQTALLLATMGGTGATVVGSAQAVTALQNEIGSGHPMFSKISATIKAGLAEERGGVRQPRTPTPESVAFKIAQGQALTRAEEQLRVNNPQAVETALNQLKATTTPVTPKVIEDFTDINVYGLVDKHLGDKAHIEYTVAIIGGEKSFSRTADMMASSQAFRTELKQTLKDIGLPEQITVYRGVKKGGVSGEYTNVTLNPEIAKKFGAVKTYTANLKDVVGIGKTNESELLFRTSALKEVVTPTAPAVAQVTPEAEAIQPTEPGGMPSVPIEAGGEAGLRPPLTTLPPEPVIAEPPSGVPPTEKPPIEGEVPTPPPEGRPRTLTDLNREARGMRALSPEERAGVMDMAKPIAEDELLYKVKPFNEHGDTLLQPDKPINKVLRSIPGIKQATEILYPAQMERENPVALIGIKKRIFEEIETGRARLASLKWWYQAKQAFDFKKVKGKWRATNIALSPQSEPAKAYHATIHDLIEHPENYVFNEQQQKILAVAQDMQNQLLRDAQRAGVDAVELSGDYWRRIVTKAPKNALFDGKIKSRITSKKGYTRQRAFEFVDDGAKLGFEYETHPLRSLQNRLEAGIRTISDQSVRKEIAKLPGIIKPLERLESRYPQTIEGVKAARQVRDTAKQTFLRAKTTENETLLRQAEADYITAMRELYFKKIAAGQPNIGELKLPNGRIAPVELAEDISSWVELPEIRTAGGSITNPILAVTQLLRSTLTNLDLAAGFIQGQALFYRNNPAWWVSQGNAILSLLDDRMAYVEKNFEVMDEGMRMGAISVPTEFMFTSQGLASIPTRVPVVGPVMKSFNRAFEWFIVVGQTELFKVARSGVIRRATGANVQRGEALERQAIEALTSLGSAIRKEMGTESYAILGVRPTQHTIEQLVLFAARFFRAMTGIQAQAFTGGEGGREARRAMGSLIAGGLALLIAASWITEKKLPNMTDPFAPDWMMFKIGKTYFSTFGPFYPYFRAMARASVRLAQGEPGEAAKVITRFFESKEGLLFRGIDMAAQFSMYGSYRTFEGKRLPATPLGIGEAVLGEMAVPISIQEAMTALPEGRYESVIGEIAGLVGRPVRLRASTEAISKLGQIDQEALDKELKGVTNPKKIAEIKEKDWTFDIQSLRRDIASGTKYLLEQDIAKLEPIVGEYWQFAEQKDEYELLSTEEKKKYVKDNPVFVVNRIFWGELIEIPDLATANAVTAKAQALNIPLEMIPAFQLTDKGKERIPSNRELWESYFDYYALPGSSYLAMSKEQVDAGKLPARYLAEWQTYQKLKTDVAKTLFRRNHKEVSRGDWRDNFRRANSAFDKWLQENEGLKPLKKPSVRRAGGVSQPSIALARREVSRGGGVSFPSRRKVRVPKFPKPRISAGMSIRAPVAPRV